MKQDDEKHPKQQIYQYQVLICIEQLMVSYQDELYYEGDLMDMELNQFRQYDLYMLNADN